MSFEMKNNSGSLFKNKKKESDKHPDYTGSAMLGGKEMKLAAWIKESKKGEKFMSLSFRDKDGYQKNSMPNKRPSQYGDSDEVPF